MALVPFAYHRRSLWARKVTTLATLGGIALVVFVFSTVLMLAAGVESTLAATGHADNAMALRKGASAELQSLLACDAVQALTVDPAIVRDARGPLVSAELVVLLALERAGGGRANVTLRGLGPRGLDVHEEAQITDGRMLIPGRAEVVIGSTLLGRFAHASLGEQLRLGRREFRIVGVLQARGSAFESEIWGSADELMPAFSRTAFSSVTARLQPGALADFVRRLDADPRLSAEARSELGYYGDQSRGLALFVRILGLFLAVVFSVGAMIGAMMTLYAQVDARRKEIGTLHALGFARSAILVGFLAEALLLALSGGAIGLAASSLMGHASFSIMNLATVSEVVFHFRLTARIALAALGFSTVIGLLGGLPPALRAARTPLLDVLR